MRTGCIDSSHEESHEASIRKAFVRFRSASELLDIMNNFQILRRECGIGTGTPYKDVYPMLRAKASQSHLQKQIWNIIEKKRRQRVYRKKILADKKILIVGGGPAGLLMAIECSLLGADVTV